MRARTLRGILIGGALVLVASSAAFAQQQERPRRTQDRPSDLPVPLKGKTSYAPVAIEESFEQIRARYAARKDEAMARQRALLEERYEIGRASWRERV